MRLSSLVACLLALLCVLAQAAVARGRLAQNSVLQHDMSSVTELLARANSLAAKKPALFVPQAVPNTNAEPTCTAYARQDNCVGYPSLRTDALPPCGSFAGPLPRNTSAFAIIGDYGLDGNCASLVASLLMKAQKQFGELQFVMSTGDNAYWSGSCASFMSGVSQYYSSFLPASAPTCIDPMRDAARDELISGEWEGMQQFQQAKSKLREAARRAKMQRLARAVAAGVEQEELMRRPRPDASASSPSKSSPIRFFPTLGNHDWDTYASDPAHMPYFQFFNYLADFEPSQLGQGQFFRADTLIPGVELFTLNSNLGKGTASQQVLHGKMIDWLRVSLRNSTAPFKLVYFHHPPIGTAQHDALAPWMDHDFEGMGASAVFVGHQHVYERLVPDRVRPDGSAQSMPFIINGLGGHPWTYQIDGCPPFPGSQFRYNAFHGMQLGVHSWDEEAQKEKIDICFYSYEKGGSMMDHFTIMAGGSNNSTGH